MIAAIVLDTWKLPYFKEILDEGQFQYTENDGVTDDTVTLKVETKFICTLQPFVEKAQQLAEKNKP